MDDDEYIKQTLDKHARRMENIVQTRFNAIMDQVNKIATEHNNMATRVYNLEKVIKSQSVSNYYIASDVQFIRNELEALENYLAEGDSKLRALLDYAKEQIKLENKLIEDEKKASNDNPTI